MSNTKCGSCEKSNIVEDGGNLVCTDCGCVQEDATSYEPDAGLEKFGQDCHSGSSYNPTFASNDYRLFGAKPKAELSLKLWLKYVSQICISVHIKSKAMRDEAAELFRRAFKAKRFRLLQSRKKRALCASCVYVTCRQHDWPILISNLEGVTATSDVALKKMSQDLVNEFKIELKTLSLEDYVPTCLKTYGVTDEALVDKTTEVISLAVDLMLSTGRKATEMILGCCCVAWRALSHKNYKLPMTHFGESVLKKKPRRCVYLRYRELTDRIVKMASKVPWVPKDLLLKKENAWMFYLDDVLKFKQSLMSCPEAPADSDGEETWEDGPTKGSLDTSIVVPPSYEAGLRKRALQTDDEDISESISAKSRCMSRESLESPILSEKDIPDSELNLYIKTPEEVEMAKQLAVISDSFVSDK